VPTPPPSSPWKDRWKTIAPSEFPWEEEALQQLKAAFAGRALRAWSNFQFITQEGNIYEVDLLLLTRAGLYLIEIKSWPGILRGDTCTWTVTEDRRQRFLDNPILLANRKTKSLKSILLAQPAFKMTSKLKLPYIQPVVYLSNKNLENHLVPLARAHVYTHADLKKMVEDLETPRHGPAAPPNLAVEKAVCESMQRAGIRRPNKAIRVGDYQLGRLLDEGPGWQDRVAKHTSINLERRVRQYLFSVQKSDEARQVLRRAARREFEVCESIRHPNILRALEFREHENGPALIFDYDPKAVRLDHLLTSAKLPLDARLKIVRQVAEALAYAHSRKVLHRALSPRCILVHDNASVTVMNWQTSQRDDTTEGVTGTIHVKQLVESGAQVYLAPEALSNPRLAGQYSDIFSLGALTHFVITGQAPAADRLALDELLREQRGLLPSAVSDGVVPEIDELVEMSTRPDVDERISTVAEFLELLAAVEDTLSDRREHEVSPLDAQPGEVLEGGFTLIRRLGRGSVSLALLVKRDEQEYVLKIAQSPADNETLAEEARVLEQLHDRHVVRLHQVVDIAGHAGLLLSRAGDRTLAERLQKDGPLNLDLLQRLGTDLLDVLVYLEETGIHHRDVKPANLGVASIAKKRLELVLFDFSLSRAPLDNIRAGTAGYLDPFLSLRRPPRWDLHAERYAAAVTLYEMATGLLPRWGDGKSDPGVVASELALDAERLDPSVREPLTAFFHRAMDRDWKKRFDNAEEMRAAWREAFAVGARAPAPPTTLTADEVTLDTSLALLGLPAAQVQATDRLGVTTVRDLLSVSSRQLRTMRGVSGEARRALAELQGQLRERFGQLETVPAEGDVVQGLDPICRRLLERAKDEGLARSLWTAAEQSSWPSSAELADVSPVAAAARLQTLAGGWARDKSVDALVTTVAELVEANQGVMEVDELAAALLSARGSVQEDRRLRMQQARFAARAALEVEAGTKEPRFLLRRTGEVGVVAVSPELAAYAAELGRQADVLADADPLASPARALQTLREVATPALDDPLSDHRLLRLATACGRAAELSSRQEVYPRGMPALRALVLAHGSLLANELSVDDIQERVRSRYPHAEPLPGRTALDDLLRKARWDFVWDEDRARYVRVPIGGMKSSSSTWTRWSTTEGTRGPVTEAVAVARMLEERLQHAERDGAFLVLAVSPPRLREAEKSLRTRFSVEPVWLDEALIGEMRRLAAEYEARWDTVIDTDADPSHPDRRHLVELAQEAMAAVEARIRGTSRTVLLSRAGLVARYGLMDRLEALRDAVGRRDGIFGLWLLVPCDESQAVPAIDGQAVPLMSAAQHARISEGWLKNIHRARAEAS
jgi:serine/threonine protein kinase